MPDTTIPKVAIVGAGFAGLWAARTLAKQKVQVTLIDRNNFHLFSPLLYQISAAEIEPEEIAYPVRSILRRYANVCFDLAEVKRITIADKKVVCEDHEVSFDYLILATGSTTNFFNITGAAEHSFPLKSMAEGIRLRHHILCRFEHAVHESDESILKRRLTFVIVGGGPTGVEFAGALSELIQGPLKKDFPEIDFGQVHIILIEAKDNLLDMLPPGLKTYVAKRLGKMGMEILLNRAVSRVTASEVHLKDGTVIPTETVVWTAGVRGFSFPRTPELPTLPNGRIEVLPTLQSKAFDHVYAAGDLASASLNNQPLPLVAPVAIAQGIWAGRNILRQISGQPPLPFRYRDRGTMVTIGRNRGVASIGKLKMKGFPAWLLWAFVHLFKLVGFRNRLLVLIDWAWDYLFFERSVRLILYSSEGEKEC